MTENKRLYDVINKTEPRGQSVTYAGIPCTARTCVTRLNRLTEENKQLKQQLSEQRTQIDVLKNENIQLEVMISFILILFIIYSVNMGY